MRSSTPHSTPRSAQVPAPTRVGRYELITPLASGGMGEVYVARLLGDAGFAKLVAIKLLRPELVASEAFVEMFRREAQLAAQLSHPNVCEVHDFGVEEGRHYLVMPYLRGVGLDHCVPKALVSDPAQDLRLCLSLVAQACDGLHHAHELVDEQGRHLGLVHRDISPSNLFLTNDGQVKLLDFGVAKAHGATQLTRGGELKGKSAYMSPEQLRGASIDRRSDLFALGTVLFELCTHSRLFERDSDFLMAKAIIEESIPLPSTRAMHIPASVDALLHKALQRRASDRFQTANEFATALRQALLAMGGEMSTNEIALRLSGTVASMSQAATSLVDTAIATYVQARRGRSFKRYALMAALPIGLGVGSVLLALGAFQGSASDEEGAQDAVASLAPKASHERDAGLGAGPLALDTFVMDAGRASEAAVIDGAVAPLASRPESNKEQSAKAPGFLSIDSNPYALIFIDGKKRGPTPLIKLRLAPGKHSLRAQLADGRSQRLNLRINSGELAAPIVLTW